MIFLILLVIPLILATVMFFIFKKDITLMEFLIQIGIQIIITAVSSFIIYYSNVSFTEVWNGCVTSKESNKVSCRHSYPCNPHSCNCDKNGCSTCWDTCYEHSYDIDWNVIDNTKEVWAINTIDRQGLIEPPRWTIVKKGDTTSHTHKYKNYIKASPDSLFSKQGLVDQFKGTLPEYPIHIYDYYKLDRIVLINIRIGDTELKKYNQILSEINARLGKKKQVNAILVVVRSKPYEWFFALDQYWLGGNKNDAILVISIDDENRIQWADTIALVQSQKFKVALNNAVLDLKKFDMDKILSIFRENIKANFKRRHMADFEYLKASITPSTAQWVISLIVSIACTIGLSWFFKENEVY
jgi:hypothetical protein